MPKVRVKLYPPLSDLLRVSEFVIDANFLGEVLNKLENEPPLKMLKNSEVKNLRSSYIIVVNGKRVLHSKINKFKLREGDTVLIFPPLVGG